MKRNLIGITLLFWLVVSIAQSATAVTPPKNNKVQVNKTTPGELYVEPPTLLCLGFEWNITGDDNHNAKAEVWYRKKGDQNWKPALPLMRLQNEQINNYSTSPDNAVFAKSFNYTAPNMFAGSIFDLEPDTVYETRFLMSDPDGVVGNIVGKKDYRYATVRTRAEPQPFAGGKVLHIYPEGYVGKKQEPAFTGLMEAYDPLNRTFVSSSGAQAGDILLVHAGTYSPTSYTISASDSPRYLLNRSGTAEKPIVIKSAGDGEVIFDGKNNPVLFDVMGGNYQYFEGITIRNARIGIMAGEKKVTGANGLTVKKSRFENVANGIWAMYAGSKNFYIVDNTIFGRARKESLVGGTSVGTSLETFWQSAPGYPADQSVSDYGIHLFGAGHVVAYNEIAYFWDGINTSFYNELPSAQREFQQVSNDFYNNYIHTVSDNATSIEEHLHNGRMFRNLFIDVAGTGTIGLTHNWGGPLYVIRNIAYHSPDNNTLKLFGATGGVLIYNNTLFSEIALADHIRGDPLLTYPHGVSNVDFRNNLVLGAESAAKVPAKFKANFNGVYFAGTYTGYTQSDYNGFRPNPGASPQFIWFMPSLIPGGRDYLTPIIEHRADTLPQLCAATGKECHGKLVDYDIFQKVSQPDRNDHTKLYPKELFDFRLKPNTAAVDAGYPLPNINDGFTGAAPDLGALELGQPVPHYGPRP